MRRRTGLRWALSILGVAAMVGTVLSLSAAAGDRGGRGTPPVPFSKARILIELNETAQDAGIQMLLDGDGWRRVEVYNPNNRKVLEVEPSGAIARIGMTELFFESAEPSLAELPLADLLKMFPEGNYRIVGRTAEGERMAGTAVLRHDIPAGARVVTPATGALVDPGHLVIDWDPVADPPGGRIGGYQVIVELPEPLRVFSVDLPASVTSLTVPPEFLQAGTEYKFEVLSVTESRNQTIVESTFRTR